MNDTTDRPALVAPPAMSPKAFLKLAAKLDAYAAKRRRRAINFARLRRQEERAGIPWDERAS